MIQAEEAEMIQTKDFQDLVARYEAAAAYFGKGNAGPVKEFCAREADLTLMGGAGGCVKGWEEVTSHMDWAASHFSGATDWQYELLAGGLSGDIGYAVVIEHERGADVKGGDRSVARSLRSTVIFRRYGHEWKMIHRHADPMVSVINPADLFKADSSRSS